VSVDGKRDGTLGKTMSFCRVEPANAFLLWIDRSSPFRHAMVLGYTNRCESYIPTDRDFALGGYEAASFPQAGAALRYRCRVALQPGVERRIKQQIQALWSR
jgi:hypothetical protein